jgi:hypothetical protein
MESIFLAKQPHFATVAGRYGRLASHAEVAFLLWDTALLISSHVAKRALQSRIVFSSSLKVAYSSIFS